MRSLLRVQLHLHTAMRVQPFLLLVTASAQPRLCRATPDPAACVWRTVSMQVRCMLQCKESLWLETLLLRACKKCISIPLLELPISTRWRTVYSTAEVVLGNKACKLCAGDRMHAAQICRQLRLYTLMSSRPCLQAIAALVVSPVILIILATVERRSFVRSERRRLAAAAATKGGESVSLPPASMAPARSAPPANLSKEHS